MCTLYLIYPMLSDWICPLKFKFHHHKIHITTQIHSFTSEDRYGNIGNKVDAWDTLIHPSVHSSGRALGMISMMMSSNGNIFRVTGTLCEEFPSHRPVTRSFDVLFDLGLKKPLSKQLWGWWIEMPSCTLWRHYNRCTWSIFQATLDRVYSH